jgi:hypothetical protein
VSWLYSDKHPARIALDVPRSESEADVDLDAYVDKWFLREIEARVIHHVYVKQGYQNRFDVEAMRRQHPWLGSRVEFPKLGGGDEWTEYRPLAPIPEEVC